MNTEIGETLESTRVGDSGSQNKIESLSRLLRNDLKRQKAMQRELERLGRNVDALLNEEDA